MSAAEGIAAELTAPLSKFVFCRDTGLECSYDQTEKKRGLRAGYVASLEDRLERLEGEVRVMKRMLQNQSQEMTMAAAISASGTEGSPAISLVLAPPEHDGRSIEERFGLPTHAIAHMCEIWFARYHPWFPILHKLSFLEYLEFRNLQDDSASLVVLKAILAVTLSQWLSPDLMTQERRREVVAALQKEILVHTSTNLSLPSLQAALITSIVNYGAGNLHAFWNEIAICKRVGTHLGLLDLVSNHGDTHDKITSVSPRMLALPRTVIEQEERIRAFWMTEVLDNISTLGTGWNLSVVPVESHALLPCNEIVWAFPERTVDGASSLNLEQNSLLSLYVSLVTGNLARVHVFLRQKVDRFSVAHQAQQQERCMALDERLRGWRQSRDVVETLSSQRPVHDPLVVLIEATLHMTTIIIYQRLALPAIGNEDDRQPWYHAIQRCLDACNNLSASIRSLSEDSLENNCPNLVSCIFVASRFLLVRNRAMKEDLPRCFDLLLYGINVCGQRWPFASRLEKVLRSAVVEKDRPLSESALPSQFYDLQYSSVDIDEALRMWSIGS